MKPIHSNRGAPASPWRWVAIALCTVLLACPAFAQEDALKAFPGYVDFQGLADIFGEPTVQISVGQSLLNMVAAFSASEDPEVAELFRRLNGVRVNVFETPELSEDAVDYVKSTASRLGGLGWEPVVTVNSAKEQVRIFMKLNNDLIEGITVLAVDPGEAVFINVIGSLNPAELERVMDNFDIEISGNGGAANDHEDED